MNYLRPVDYYEGDPEALLTEWKKKLKAVASKQKEVNRRIDLTKTGVGGVSF